MASFITKFFLIIAVLYSLTAANSLSAQNSVRGVVKDKETGEPLAFTNIIVKNSTEGTQTDFDGNFELKTTQKPPFSLTITYIGYETQEVAINDLQRSYSIQMIPAGLVLDKEDVVIRGSRVTEKQREAPQTIESLDLIAIKETPAANFYDGLGNLKGIDITASSMGFKTINTRGFNSTSPVRSLQLIDGVDNQAPGLNFSLGNFVGSSELDVLRVEIIAGAQTALYGPNAFNGVISMNTKSPFFHKGLSIMAKGGERNLAELALRYAHAWNDKFAFKINAAMMRANDWVANNLNEVYRDPNTGGLQAVGTNNWGGYDAVNIYGDELLAFNGGTNINSDLSSKRLLPGLGTFFRTGYAEEDLVDYDTENLKLAAALHYKIAPEIEAIYGYNFGTGTTVYQGDNRYSLNNLVFQQHKIEIRQLDKFFVRAYHTRENSGDTYDAVFTAFKLNERVRNNNEWSQRYTAYWNQNIVDKVRALSGYPDPANPANFSGWFAPQGQIAPNYAIGDSVMNANTDSLLYWHSLARAYADEGRLIPGTPEFQQAFKEITSNSSFEKGGTRFLDNSSLTHLQGEYQLQPSFADNITIGASFRLYTPDSKGTIFSDTSGVKITNNEAGIYGGITKKTLNKKLILTATARADKNQNFDLLFSPALSGVYLINERSTARIGFSSAIRNPTLQDQYLYYNVGRAILRGNLNGIDTLVTVQSLIDFLQPSGGDLAALDTISAPAVQPEKVKTVELGYKGTLFERLFIDAGYYYSWYRDFIGYKIGVDLELNETNNFKSAQAYRVATNAQSQVTTQGFSVGLSYFIGQYYAINGNYSWNVLNNTEDKDPIIPAFNTPEHKYNIGFSGRDINSTLGSWRIPSWGFSLNYKWMSAFVFEGSPQFTGEVPAYGLLDTQLNFGVPKLKSVLKIGASNVLNNRQYQAYGGPSVGRLLYLSILTQLDNL
ncbi:MAG: TonB-dependent receptor [Sphingobacteriales bacterium]|nr:TonB-dependent receptor [Sphingobacteriales bacterium]